jgi:hypothetical protein
MEKDENARASGEERLRSRKEGDLVVMPNRTFADFGGLKIFCTVLL